MPVTINGIEYLDTEEAAALVGRDPVTIRYWLAPGRGEAERLRPDLQRKRRNYYIAEHIKAFFASKRDGKGRALNRAHKLRRKSG